MQCAIRALAAGTVLASLAMQHTLVDATPIAHRRLAIDNMSDYPSQNHTVTMKFVFHSSSVIKTAYITKKFHGNVSSYVTDHMRVMEDVQLEDSNCHEPRPENISTLCIKFCDRNKKNKKVVACVVSEVLVRIALPIDTSQCENTTHQINNVCKVLRLPINPDVIVNDESRPLSCVCNPTSGTCKPTPPTDNADSNTTLTVVVVVVVLIIIALIVALVYWHFVGESAPGEQEMAQWEGAQETLHAIDDDTLLPDKDGLEVGKEIARGQFGIVFKGTWETGGVEKPVAIKQLMVPKRDLDLFSKITDDFKAEVGIVAELCRPPHRNIIMFHGCITEPQLCVVCDLALRGSLYGLLRKGFVPRNHEGVATEMALDIAEGLHFMHVEKQMLHRDIKSLNILVGENWECLLTDFGQTIEIERVKNEKAAQAGTPYWTAPEVFDGEPYTPKADVYSFAMTMFEIETGEVPWDCGNMEVGYLVAKEEKRPDLPANFDPQFKQVMMECWEQDPGMRCTMLHAVEELKKIQRGEGSRPTLPGGYLHKDNCPPGSEPGSEPNADKKNKAAKPTDQNGETDMGKSLLD